MNPHELQSSLRRYEARFPAEAALAREFSSFCLEPDFLSRQRGDGHGTGSAWVVSPCGERVLLTLHRKLGRWLQLGGHGEGESLPFAIAWREAKEESGLIGLEPVSREIFDLDRHWIPARRDEPGHWHWDFRYAFRAPEEAFCVSEESVKLAWIEIAELAEREQDPSLARMARKWREHHS